jgi:acyl-coenzyme A synthetase/AMP-(fatty) acid ligase
VAVVDEIFAHARRAPDRPAVTYRGRTLGYRELAARIVLARGVFDRLPLDRERPVILCVHHLMNAWIAGLALRSLGLTTVSGRTAEDLEQLDLGVLSVVFIGHEDWSNVAEAAVQARFPVVQAPDLWDVTTTAVPPEAMTRPEGAATGKYILLTSATTGIYKKVLIDPAYEPEEVRDRIDQFPELGPDTVVNMFGFGGWTAIGYFVPMIVWRLGGRVVLDDSPEPWSSLTPDVTMAYVHPALLALILSAPAGQPPRNDGMTLVVIAGVLSEAQWLAARTRLTNDVRTTLGSTEAGCCGVTTIRSREDLIWHQLRPNQAEIVDENHLPVPDGQVGQMRTRVNRVDYYLGDEAATRTFFRDGYFYPGDLAVIRGDKLSLQGRVTDVINVGGSKYATLPLEFALQERLAARAVHVFSHTGQDGEEVHVAIQPGPMITAGALKAALSDILPTMPLARVHRVDDFPRNNMGKIERAVLKAQLGLAGPS